MEKEINIIRKMATYILVKKKLLIVHKAVEGHKNG